MPSQAEGEIQGKNVNLDTISGGLYRLADKTEEKLLRRRSKVLPILVLLMLFLSTLRITTGIHFARKVKKYFN
ncbi:Hypothetical predicted protein [Octopus vulgaris]|uniref:Uncharacterized protein n=1 Tax=Octopus vulgaris TaxID=6645 RepID=A0AA36BEX8_OCTVU|nr:Hypothetical predicted protein [Octopus vulgaris]